ncbi:glycosyltransferase like 2 family protein [Clostridium botulinum]|uniref:glycosyltransferase family 2 protein n=1 Tax=Clostridium botulinum TaxID=1491 RepID=UPI0009475EBC|nr:glycosyltransferase [Clostridium botulinum]APR01532.1 glycosyltransferase like 2 family protein [Clostridium botulinum]
MYKYTFIIPNYNKAKYLKQCIDSIINQSYKNFNLIIIDDCSTDDSVKIINLYKNMNNVKIIKHKTNMGKSYTFNEGFKNAEGDYITIMGSDDYIKLNALENIDRFLLQQNQKIDFIYTDFYIYENEENKIKNGYISKDITIEELLFGCNITSLCTFYSKDLINNVTGFDEEFAVRGQDYDFIIRALCYGNSIYLDKRLAFYRVGLNNSVPDFSILANNYHEILLKNKDIFLKHTDENIYNYVIKYYEYIIENNKYNSFILDITLIGTFLMLKKYMYKKSSISIYGAGGLLELVLFLCNEFNIKVNNIYDKFKYDTYYLDYPIQNPNKIKNDEFIFICATVDKDNIINFLESKGLIHYYNYVFYDEYHSIKKYQIMN